MLFLTGFSTVCKTAYTLMGVLLAWSLLTTSQAVDNTASASPSDSFTQGSWKGGYGSEGYRTFGDSTNDPSYAAVTVTGAMDYTWAAATSDGRALQTAAIDSTNRIAACIYSDQFTIDIACSDAASHQVAIYALDWDRADRSQLVEVLDGTTGTVLDSRSVGSFSGGTYLIWSITGHVTIRATVQAGFNAVISGLFFGVTPPSSSGMATFASTDRFTQGDWKNRYGSEGFQTFSDATQNPSYASVTVSGALDYTWQSSTTDGRALRRAAAGSTDRQAACAYNDQFAIDIACSDTATHQVAIYALDWDRADRSELVEVVDGRTGTVLDTRTLSDFSRGAYLVWAISGHVKIRTTVQAGFNAVISGIFFGVTQPSSAGTATFAAADSTTQGDWKGVYGTEGAQVFGNAGADPSYATVGTAGAIPYTWESSTTDGRGLETFAIGSTDRIAACDYDGQFIIDIACSDTASHQVAIYALDWDRLDRSELVEVLDGGTGAVLDTRALSDFSRGRYLVWTITGHVKIRTTPISGINAVISGVFFGTTPAIAAGSATYVTTDVSTQGSWKGVYGAEGFRTFADVTSDPSFASVTLAGALQYVWDPASTDVRALQKGAIGSTDRIAATDYDGQFTIDIACSDTSPHQVAVYALDWDSLGRNEVIDILDGRTGAILDTRNVSNFSAGMYVVWNITGHVKIRTTPISGINAVLSGVFFGGGSVAPNQPPSFTKGADISISADAGPQSVSNWATNISAGPSSESGQTLTFSCSSDNQSLFANQPALAANGALTFTPNFIASGSAVVSVTLHDNGGTANNGHDTSGTQTFVITILPVIYHLADGLSAPGNPSNGWTYGWLNADFSNFHLYTRFTPGSGGNYDGWDDPLNSLGSTPGIFFQQSTKNVALHPGPTGLASSAKFTMPRDGMYQINAQFHGDTATTDVHVLANGAILSTANLSGGGPGILLTNVIFAHAGDTLGVAVGAGGNGSSSDTTFVDATIRPIGGMPTVNFATDTLAISESSGTVTIPFSLSVYPTSSLSIPFSVQGGTASNRVDTLLTSGFGIVPAGQMTGSISVVMKHDAFVSDGPQTLILQLNSSGNILVGSQSTMLVTLTMVHHLADGFLSPGNPSNGWTYGWSSPDLSDFHIYTRFIPGVSGNYDAWDDPVNTSPVTPGIFYQRESKLLVMHPGPYGQASNARWTLPRDGIFQIDAQFSGASASTDVHVMANAHVVSSSYVFIATPSQSLSSTVFGHAGDSVGVAVGYGGNGNANDSTFTTATIQSAPTTETAAFTSATMSVSEINGTITIPLSLSIFPASPVLVPFSIEGGTAIRLVDYVLTSSTGNIPGGLTTGSISIVLKHDFTLTGPKTILLMLHPLGLVAIGSQSTILITILDQEVQQPPVAINQNYQVTTGGSVDIRLTATDPNSDALHYKLLSNPAHGTLSGTAPIFVYQPAVGFSGTDSFTFNANDSQSDSNVGTISVEVLAAVTANNAARTSLLKPSAFDMSLYQSDPVYRRNYLGSLEPGRVWLTALAGASVPVLESMGPRHLSLSLATVIHLPVSVKSAVAAPVTFFCSADGYFQENGKNVITIESNGSGIATVNYCPAKIGREPILVASPGSTGTVRFLVEVTP